MIRLRHKLLINAFRVFDQALLSVTLLALIGFLSDEGEASRRVSWLLDRHYQGADAVGVALLLAGWFLIFNSLVRYNANRFTPWISQLKELLRATSLAAFFLLVIGTMFHYRSIGPMLVVYFWVLTFLIFGLSRLLITLLLRLARRSGLNQRYIIFVGCNSKAFELATRLESSPELGYKIVGFVDDRASGAHQDSAVSRWPVMGRIQDLQSILEKGPVDEILICLPGVQNSGPVYDVIKLGKDLGVVVRLVPTGLDMSILFESHIEFYDGEYIITFFRTSRLWELLLKRIIDVTVSLLMMLCLSPLMLAFAILIKITSPGPVLFVQPRVGMNKRTFRLYKFRSMVVGADHQKDQLLHLNEMDGPVFKIKNDPRVTKLGRFIRKTSIDELPQLFNVFKGDMSLVGPRPPLPSEVDKYEWLNRKRLSIRPGLTCLWQISGRNNLSFEEWMKLDKSYIDNWSIWLDLKILIATIPVVIFGKGAA